MYLIRLDDASYFMNIEKWNQIETILDKYSIKPIVGIIPKNEDSMFQKYKFNDGFWDKALKWQEKGWIIALHGYEHKYVSSNSGINPIHKRSEFAGLSLEEQKFKIQNGYNILKNKGLFPKVFFAPSHTFDKNTLIAIKEETPIKIISDTVSNDIYFKNDLYFIPVQTGKPRKLPFKVITICLHPNEMSENDFLELENFIIQNKLEFKKIILKKRKYNYYDWILQKIYFMIKRIK